MKWRARLCISRRHLAEALLGRRSEEREHSGGYRVKQDGYREVLGVAEGTKEDKASWQSFLRYLKERGLKEMKLLVGNKCLGLVESHAGFCPEAAYQRCELHIYRNVWSLVPATKVRAAAAMLKAIHASEDREGESRPGGAQAAGDETACRRSARGRQH